MRQITSSKSEATALVLGSNEVASAIAHALRKAGWAVVLIDEVDPACPLRGMSFVNAWYFGTAELDGVAACFCASVRSVPSIIDHRERIAATTWSWQGVAAALLPRLLVDARSANGGVPDAQLRHAPEGLATMGCGPGFAAPDHVHIAIDTSYGREMGTTTTNGIVPSELGNPGLLAGVGVERFVVAPRTGRLRTQLRLAEPVRAGDVLGEVSGARISAPVSGVLRGLTARGARVSQGQVVAEVDIRGDPALCYGIDPRAARIARAVIDATDQLGLREDAWSGRNVGVAKPPDASGRARRM